MPWASVIKITHRDYHKGNDDGVEVVWDRRNDYRERTDRDGKASGLCMRPNRRAWNHPCLIVQR